MYIYIYMTDEKHQKRIENDVIYICHMNEATTVDHFIDPR